MKMQNARLAFIAFDAQDVIATSGSGRMYFPLNGIVSTGSNKPLSEIIPDDYIKIGPNDTAYYIDLALSGITQPANFYAFDSATWYNSAGINYVLHGVTLEANAPSGTKLADTLAVYNWLYNNATPRQ